MIALQIGTQMGNYRAIGSLNTYASDWYYASSPRIRDLWVLLEEVIT
jgi:hypothetical protein